MYELDKKGNVKRDKNGGTKAKTSHTLNPVPFILISPPRRRLRFTQGRQTRLVEHCLNRTQSARFRSPGGLRRELSRTGAIADPEFFSSIQPGCEVATPVCLASAVNRFSQVRE